MARRQIIGHPCGETMRKKPEGSCPKGVHSVSPRKTIGQCAHSARDGRVGGMSSVVAALPHSPNDHSQFGGLRDAFDTSPR